MDNTAILLKNVTKKYSIHHEKPTLVETVLNGKVESFTALNKINVSVKKGERLGIIGSNGSGKTTLLKLIAGISAPTSGRIDINGRVVSLIDLEAGFHPDLSGYQNIFLNGMILGMRNSEIAGKIKQIISFANIGKFIDVPLFTYSEGMKVRLGFSIAVHSDPNILVLDENISVGDQNFAQISYTKIRELINKEKIIIVASHNMSLIKDLCKRVVWLEKGRVNMDGPTSKVVSGYLKNYRKNA